jgi:hypothetical protein
MAYNQPEEFIYLATRTASSSASLEFKSVITSQYPVYYMKIRSLIPATDNTALNLVMSSDNGATYLAGTGYSWSNYTFTSNANGVQTKSNSAALIQLGPSCSNSTNNIGINAEFYLFGFAQTGVAANLQGKIGYEDTSGLSNANLSCGGQGTTLNINAIKISFSSGNIASGNIYMYGMII